MKRARLSQIPDIDRGCAPSPAPRRNVHTRRPSVELARRWGCGGYFPRLMSAGDMAHEITIRQGWSAILFSHFLRERKETDAVADREDDGARRQAGLHC